MREAFAPVGLALETGRRRFASGEQIATAVFVTNDDENQKDYSDLRLEVSFLDGKVGKETSVSRIGRVPKLAYYETVRVPVQVTVPSAVGRQQMALRVRLLAGAREISRTTDLIEIIPVVAPANLDVPAFVRGVGPDVNQFLETHVRFKPLAEPANARVLVLGEGDELNGLEKNGALRMAIERGGTAIIFSPGEKFTAMFTSDVGEGKVAPGEYADFSPCAGTPLAADLAPMDLKWWGRKDDWRVFVANTSHRLRSKTTARELIRFIPAHSYIAADKVPEQYRTVMFEIPLGRGRLWVCDLDLESSISIDPAAHRFAMNLFRAAAEPDSTAKLPKLPTHEELLKATRGTGN